MMLRPLTNENVVTKTEVIGKDEIRRVEDAKEYVTSWYVKVIHQH